MACRGLPPQQRRWGLVIGAGVAVMLRIIFAGVVARLMLLPYLKLVGGVALTVIAAKLLVPEDPDRDEIQAVAHLWRAVMIIAVADIVMSLDNIVAIAAIAQGNVVLLAIGLAVSIPLIVAGAALVMALLDRFPILIWAGAALLGWIAGEVIVADPALSAHLAATFGAQLAQQIEFAAPATGAALAIAAGGLWRCWHETELARGRPASRRRIARIPTSARNLQKQQRIFAGAASSLDYDVDKLRRSAAAVGLCSHACAVFFRLADRQSDFGHPACWCCLADTIASDFPQNLACGANRGICTPHVLAGVQKLRRRLR